jgi:hypothetical protein
MASAITREGGTPATPQVDGGGLDLMEFYVAGAAPAPCPCGNDAAAAADAASDVTARGGDGARGGDAVHGGGKGTPAEIARALEGLTTTTDECAEDVEHAEGTPCASRKMIGAVSAFVKTGAGGHGAAAAAATGAGAATGAAIAEGLLPDAATREAAAVREAAQVLGCGSESCVIAHPAFAQFVEETKVLPASEIPRELALRYKAAGPRDEPAWLNDRNIDETLLRWARVFRDFYPCPFAMMDFDKTREPFAALSIPALLTGAGAGASVLSADNGAMRPNAAGRSAPRPAGPVTTFGCVVNTDESGGTGKHWVAVFVDCRAAVGDLAAPWTVEYFNSVGRPPPRPMVAWMERTRAQLVDHRARAARLPASARGAAEIVQTLAVTDIDHQESRSECGLYAMYYIRRRLEGTPPAFFSRQRVPDEAMVQFRKHVFRAGR